MKFNIIAALCLLASSVFGSAYPPAIQRNPLTTNTDPFSLAWTNTSAGGIIAETFTGDGAGLTNVTAAIIVSNYFGVDAITNHQSGVALGSLNATNLLVWDGAESLLLGGYTGSARPTAFAWNPYGVDEFIIGSPQYAGLRLYSGGELAMSMDANDSWVGSPASVLELYRRFTKLQLAGPGADEGSYGATISSRIPQYGGSVSAVEGLPASSTDFALSEEYPPVFYTSWFECRLDLGTNHLPSIGWVTNTVNRWVGNGLLNFWTNNGVNPTFDLQYILTRDGSGRMVTINTFPAGLTNLVNYLHASGFKCNVLVDFWNIYTGTNNMVYDNYGVNFPTAHTTLDSIYNDVDQLYAAGVDGVRVANNGYDPTHKTNIEFAAFKRQMLRTWESALLYPRSKWGYGGVNYEHTWTRHAPMALETYEEIPFSGAHLQEANISLKAPKRQGLAWRG